MKHDLPFFPWINGSTIAFSFFAMALVHPVVGQTYTAVDLNPAGEFEQSGAVGVSDGQQFGFGFGPSTEFRNHALLWTGTAATVIDLNPAGYNGTAGWAVSGGQQVGNGNGPTTGYENHALLWSGTATSVVDLHPAGFRSSYAQGVTGGRQVGYGLLSGPPFGVHALLWSGSAASVVDLHPAAFSNSAAQAVSSDQQVGAGDTLNPQVYSPHALLWSGTASSVVDLHPAGFTYSAARGVSNGLQVGFGGGVNTGNQNHALLWSGSASSAVDLNPPGFTASEASGISNGREVGWGSGPPTGNRQHALLWSGSATNFVDLNNFLPSSFRSSEAFAIDANGNVVGGAFDSNGLVHAVLWIPVVIDSDGDGVPDDLDVCPGTTRGEIVDVNGCSIAQLVPCTGPVTGGTWKTHGQYVRSVAKKAGEFLVIGLITEEQKSAIISEAAKSDCGRQRH